MISRESLVWAEVEAFCEERLRQLRTSLEQPRPENETIALRMQIATFKEVLRLPDRAVRGSEIVPGQSLFDSLTNPIN